MLLFLIMSKALWSCCVVFSKNDDAGSRLWWELDQFGSVCISTATYLVLIDGSPKGFFSSSRELSQGDPISAYIFLLCAGLSSQVTQSEQSKRLSGVAASCGDRCLNQLFFANDCVVFRKASRLTCDEILRVFDCYEKLSGC